MADLAPPVEGEIVHELPHDMCQVIGKIMVAHATLEHKLTGLAMILLQLNKAESRIAIRQPRTVDRLELALDLFAIKDIEIQMDTQALRETISKATAGRDKIAHGIWLKVPDRDAIHLRIARGQWPKDLSRGERVSRVIYPQSIPFGLDECQAILDLVLLSMNGVDALGEEIDHALQTSPEKFQPPAPLLNPLGNRTRKDNPRRRGSSRE